MTQALPPGVSSDSGLARYWDKPLSDLAQVAVPPIAEADAERHRIASLVVMALIYGYWNGNKAGPVGHYPWREGQRIEEGRYVGDNVGDRYLGHNIACIAVDENGSIIDFEFNHNELFNSSAEHAEARLVRRLFSLNQSYNEWQTIDPVGSRSVKYGNVFNGITIYTSLESCAQCSGIMTLAGCLRVVYLQSDPGQYLVGNLLYNLSRPYPPEMELTTTSRPKPAPKYWAPEPVAATLFGFEFMKDLDGGYGSFVSEVKADPANRYFFRSPDGWKDRSSSITSFLCTDIAREIYRRGAEELADMEVADPLHRPARSDGGVDGVRSNAELLQHARAFVNHSLVEARRGTPHR